MGALGAVDFLIQHAGALQHGAACGGIAHFLGNDILDRSPFGHLALHGERGGIGDGQRVGAVGGTFGFGHGHKHVDRRVGLDRQVFKICERGLVRCRCGCGLSGALELPPLKLRFFLIELLGIGIGRKDIISHKRTPRRRTTMFG